MKLTKSLLVVALCALALQSRTAQAFCGFYVAGADAKLFNNATLVVMMRQGTRTVLSMQNNYQGPPQDFAMVVPVPVVLQKENVKTLSNDIFARVDTLAAPRLVEYWEQDPCAPPEPQLPMAAPGAAMEDGSVERKGGVKIEAQFEVGEYQVVVLSAGDSSGLDSWLRDNGYKIPAGAEPLFRPYIQSGSKFFVAKVDVKKVTFKNGQAMLSPLRIHYDTEQFSLPVRLGLINSAGKQDLIVHILAKQRYEVANYENVTIPTNLDVSEDVRARFGAFYAALFDLTLEKNPKAVVTEYAWDSGSCDPCPSPPLSQAELATLGADVLPDDPGYGMVLTRLHARYDKSSLGEDLVFKETHPIEGGREVVRDGRLETGGTKSSYNNFQGRYAMRHPWKGAIACESPLRGRWGGPPDGSSGNHPPVPATDLAFAPRKGVELASLVTHDVSEVGLKAQGASVSHAGAVPTAAPQPPALPAPTGDAPLPPAQPSSGACGSCDIGAPRSGDVQWLALLAAAALAVRGRRRAAMR